MNKVRLFYRSNCRRSKHAEEYLKKFSVNLELIDVDKDAIYEKDIFKILEHTDNGVSELIKSGYWTSSLTEILDRMTLSEMVKYLLKNRYLIRTPLLIDKNKVILSTNPQELSVFIPRFLKKKMFEKNLALVQKG